MAKYFETKSRAGLVLDVFFLQVSSPFLFNLSVLTYESWFNSIYRMNIIQTSICHAMPSF